MVCSCSLIGTEACKKCTSNPNKEIIVELDLGFASKGYWERSNPDFGHDAKIKEREAIRKEILKTMEKTGCGEALCNVLTDCLLVTFEEYKYGKDKGAV